MQGIVVFLRSDIGTKSESLQPYLYTGMGELIRLYKSGDNPFENESLVPYDSFRVRVTGQMSDTQVLMVESILLYAHPSIQPEDLLTGGDSGCAACSEDTSTQNESEVSP